MSRVSIACLTIGDAYMFSSLNFSRNKELVPLDELIDTLRYVAEWAVM